MSEHELLSDASEELSALLVSLVLGDVTDEQIGRLNDLLQGDAANRRLAVQFLADEAVLRHRFQMLGRVGDYHNPPQGLPEFGCTITTLACQEGSAAKRSRSRRNMAFPLLASLLVAAFFGAWWFGQIPGNRGNSSLAESELDRDDQGRLATSFSAKNSGVLPRVERVSWAGPQFATELEPHLFASPMHPGVIPFTSVDGRVAVGFMVELAPKALLELVVTADAHGENALSVIEFESDGRPTGRKMSFSNNYGDSATAFSVPGVHGADTRYGPLGTWAERNNSSRPRFYFLTCVHKPLVQSGDRNDWHISRMSVLLDEPDLMHVGWDDSGLLRSSDGKLVPDEDYDDLSATIRIYEAGKASASATGRLRIMPQSGMPPAELQEAGERARDGREIDMREFIVSGEEPGFAFSVAAGEALILKLINRATVPMSIALVDKETGGTKWSCEHLRPSFSNTGFCVIKNDTLQSRQFILVGRHKSTSVDARQPWLPSDFSVLFNQDTFVTLALQGGPGDADFETVKVDMLRMNSL